MALVLCLVFLQAVARFYHPGYGFTALIGFPEGHEYEAPQIRAVPHWAYPAWASYDGQFYAQRALDPLLRDPQVDRAMDLAPYRARRILFSWTAYAAGLGRPAWILEAYALQNVVCWLVLAVLLTRWIPVSHPRTLALWTACLFSHGLLWSVRFALLDGPSLLLIALAVTAIERDRPLLAAAIGGVSTLGRETNIISLLAEPLPRSRRDWLRTAAAVVLAVAPLIVWEDYLWSIYRSTTFSGADQLTMPGSAYRWSMSRTFLSASRSGVWSFATVEFTILIALTVQAAYVVGRLAWRTPWWRVAAGYVLLMLLMDRTLWDPHTGAITRVLLPLTVGFNVLLVSEHRPLRFWPWFAAGNLHLIAALWVLPPGL
jgi:hypothetical protein